MQKISIAALTLALATLAKADCTESSQTQALISAIASLKSAVQTTDGDVQKFDKSQGVNGALSIQSTEANIESALKEVVSKTQAIDVSSLADCEASAIASSIVDVSSAVSQLLGDLVKKAADLIAVGTQSIVQGDLSSLVGETFQLESVAYQKIPCSYAASAISAFGEINAGFSSAASAYSYSITDSAPATPSTCAAGAATSAAAAGSSAAATSAAAGTSAAAATSAAESSAAAAATSGAASSAAAATSVAEVSAAAGNSTATGVEQSNGASALGVTGALAAFVGGAALLL